VLDLRVGERPVGVSEGFMLRWRMFALGTQLLERWERI